MINVFSVIHFQWNIVLAAVNSSHSLCTQRCQLQMAKGVAAGELHVSSTPRLVEITVIQMRCIWGHVKSPGQMCAFVTELLYPDKYGQKTFSFFLNVGTKIKQTNKRKIAKCNSDTAVR